MDGKVIPVKVAVRCRPLVEKEINEGCQRCLQFVAGEPQLVIGKDKAFTFDFVYDPTTEQDRVYREAVVPLLNGLFKGYNATVLAYGQTGSGKTFTMGGGYGISLETNEDVTGVIPRVIRDLFVGIKEREEKFDFLVKVSYLEIYKEDLMDLFVPLAKRDKDQMTIRDDITGGIKLIGMTEHEVQTFEDTMKLLEDGSQGRTTGATAMNHHSSRSHAIFTIHLERTNRADSHDFCKAKFHLVDLAGSERVKKTHAEGERLKEGININKGLLALGNVISALGDETVKRGHIPYRDSKLTRLLQDSLGGNSHTVMIACISPADSNMEETISTLRYADRARKIKNKPVVNRDPQAAELLRLRQLVQDLQCQNLALGKLPSVVGSGSGEMVNNRSLVDRCRLLEEEKQRLTSELQAAVTQGADMMEKVVRLELARDSLKNKLNDLKQKTGLSITQMMHVSRPSTEEGETQTSRVEELDQHISIMKEVQQTIEGFELEEVELAKVCVDEEAESEVTEEMRSKHVLRQAKLGRELQELNNMLQRKQELANQMIQSDEQMHEMRVKYEGQMKEMGTEIDKLQKEKDEISRILESVKANAVNNKLAEQRRKRMLELESQISELRRKMTEQQRMLKIKEQSDKQVEKLNEEIITMKQQRVKLMNQIKDDAEQFRRMKAEMTKEVLQLKSKDRKRQAEMAKLERQHVNQQAVMRRKAMEAAAANNRLKEVLLRQRMVADDRQKKQENASMSGIGARVRKILGDEFDFLVSVEEAKLHLDRQMSLRKDLIEQLNTLKGKLEGAASQNSMVTPEMTDDEKQTLNRQIREFDQQIDLCNAQISDLQQKLIDADQDEKNKSRWDNIHTMVEAKCAMKWLLSMAVSNKVESDKKDSEIEDIKLSYEESVKAVEVAEEEQNRARQTFEKALHGAQREQESKILYLLGQLKDSNKPSDIHDEGLRKRIAFQNAEIARLVNLEDELANVTKECSQLRKELTKAQYNSTLNRDRSLMPSDVNSSGDASKTSVDCDPAKDSKFFSPAFFAKKTFCRKRTMDPFKKPVIAKSGVTSEEERDDSSNSSDEDSSLDPDWKSGLTPGFGRPKQKSRTGRLRGSNENGCNCKTNCTSNRCICYKAGNPCSDSCGCKASDKCQNVPSHVQHSSLADGKKLSGESSLNRTFTCDEDTSAVKGVLTSTNQTTETRKRSSGNNKKKLMGSMNETSEVSDQKDPLIVEDGLGALSKKRKLHLSRPGFFDPPK